MKNKVPFIPQYNVNECGVCVLTMLLHYYGAYYKISDVRKTLDISRDGTTIRMLIDAFDFYGIKAEAFHTDIDDNMQDILPAVINWENNHYVILEKTDKKWVTIIDSNIGRIRLSYNEFYEKYSGILITVKPNQNFKKIKRTYSDKNLFCNMLLFYKHEIAMLSFLSILSEIFVLAIPIILEKFIEYLNEIEMCTFCEKYIISYVILLIMLFGVNIIISYLIGVYNARVNVKMERDVNSSLISKLLNVPYTFYDRKDNSEIFYALDNVNCVKSVYIDNLLRCIVDVLVILFIIGYFAYKKSICAVFICAISLPNIIFLIVTDNSIQKETKLTIKEKSVVSSYQIEMIHSMLGIKTTSVENNIFDEWCTKYEKYYNKNFLFYKRMNIFSVIISAIQTISPLIILLFAILFTQKGFMSIGFATAFYAMSNILFESIYAVILSLRNCRNNMASLERLDDIMNTEIGVGSVSDLKEV